jgi:hypothetical protein
MSASLKREASGRPRSSKPSTPRTPILNNITSLQANTATAAASNNSSPVSTVTTSAKRSGRKKKQEEVAASSSPAQQIAPVASTAATNHLEDNDKSMSGNVNGSATASASATPERSFAEGVMNVDDIVWYICETLSVFMVYHKVFLLI